MQEEKVQVSERVFNPNHGSLKAIFALNVVNGVTFFISIFTILFKSQFSLYHYSQEEMDFIYGIEWAIIGWTALMMILGIALRHVFLSKENVGGAIAMSILFGIFGANILNIVCGIILANSNFYTLANPEEQKEIVMNKPLSWYKSEVERLKELLESDILKRSEILEQLTSIRSTVLGIQKETSGKLNSLDARIAKLGLSKAMEEERYHLLSDYNFCVEIINIIDLDESNQNVSSDENTIEEICKKSLELPEEKKVIFDKHKKYLDDNIYTPEEFVKKVSILFK